MKQETADRRPLGGPWLRIARRVRAGNSDIERLKLCASDAIEASKVPGNVRAMVQLGFLSDDGGNLGLTQLGEELSQ